MTPAAPWLRRPLLPSFGSEANAAFSPTESQHGPLLPVSRAGHPPPPAAAFTAPCTRRLLARRGRGATCGPPPSHRCARSCLQSSGVQVNPDCLTEFEAMKIRSAHKVLTAPRLLLTRGAEAQGSPCRICSPPLRCCCAVHDLQDLGRQEVHRDRAQGEG